MLFNIFTWQYMEGNIDKALKDGNLKDFLTSYDLTPYIGESPVYSAILFYNKLSKDINIRSLEKYEIENYSPGDNKMLQSIDFDYKELCDLYKNNKGDISDDFLLFNELFRKEVEKEVKVIRNYGEVVKAASIINLVKPDLAYKILSKQLLINRDVEENILKKNKIYVKQD